MPCRVHLVPSRALPAALCAAVLGVGAAPAAADAAPKLKLGIYDCMAYNYSTGFLDYKGSVKLAARGRYEHTFGRTKTQMVDKTSGTYRVRGATVTFRGGAMAKTAGQIKRGTGARKEPFFNLLLDGEPSGISCYYVAKP